MAVYCIEPDFWPEYVEVTHNGDRARYVVERTCRNEAIELNKMAPVEFRTNNLICSNCHETFCADNEGINYPIDWAYCPCCGSLVVK